MDWNKEKSLIHVFINFIFFNLQMKNKSTFNKVLENSLTSINFQNEIPYIHESSQSVKEHWINRQIKLREKEFTTYANLL